jgi:hypothetical protein
MQQMSTSRIASVESSLMSRPKTKDQEAAQRLGWRAVTKKNQPAGPGESKKNETKIRGPTALTESRASSVPNQEKLDWD